MLSGPFSGNARSATLATRGLLGRLTDYFAPPDILDIARDAAVRRI